MDLADGLSMLENKYFLVLNLTFPGVFVLETVFQIGLFSGGVSNVYEFTLLVVWSIALSMPYAVMSSLQFRLDRLLRLPKGETFRPTIGFAIKFPLHLIGAVMTTIVFKILTFKGVFQSAEPVFPAEHVRYVVALVVACLLGYPVAWLYRRLLKAPVILDSMRRLQQAGTQRPE